MYKSSAMEKTYHPKMLNKVRNAGDGMESDKSITENTKPIQKIEIERKESLLPRRIVQKFPSKYRLRNERFAPYEPCTAAVKSMTPEVVAKGASKSKNNMDINTLISQMSQMNTDLNEFKPRSKINSSSDKSVADVEKSSSQNLELQKKVDDLGAENESLKDQLKQQVQVNKELKTMLAASMGEGIGIPVQSLYEDKKNLADALLSSAQHLSTHQEQTEWLAGQCEVWRSKFLASSLMVEELAECKNLLITKADNLHQAIKQLLDERCRCRDMLLCTYRNLYSLHEKWLEDIAISEYGSNVYNLPIDNLNFNASTPHSTNMLDLASINVKLSDNISSSVDKQDISHVNSLPTSTDGEKNAENVMAAPLNMNQQSPSKCAGSSRIH